MKNCFYLFLLLTTPLFGGVFCKSSAPPSPNYHDFKDCATDLNTDIFSMLRKISLNDKLLIKEFVEINLKWNQLSHVIYFQNKPMCLASARLRSPDKQPMDTLWLRGWKAFKKNEHLFPHPNFIFNCEIDEDEEGWKSLNLFIINKNALAKCFKEHFFLFQEIFGENCTFTWLLRSSKAKEELMRS